MDNTKSPPKIEDICQLEQQLREKLYELQNDMDTVQVIQKELVETRLALYSTELELEKERTISHELRMQLKTAMDAVNELQQQQTKNQINSVQLQVKYDTIAKQYDSMMNQVTTAKIHETECKIKIQSLQENLHCSDLINKKLKQTLKELEHNNLYAITTIDRKIVKLKEEHQHLQKSCETAIHFNQRLQTVGLCAYAIHQKDKAKIKDLLCMLASMSVKNIECVEKFKDCDNRPEMKKLLSQKAISIVKSIDRDRNTNEPDYNKDTDTYIQD